MRPKRKNPLGLETLAYFLERGTKKNRSRRNSTDSSVRSPTSTSSDVRSPTRTRTATSTDAYTAGNITVTGGAGAGKTSVVIHQRKPNEDPKGGKHAPRNTAKSNRGYKACKASVSRGNAGKVQKFYIRLNAGSRKNPEGTAAERYEYFHGRQAEIDTTVETKFKEHTVLSGIGKLLKLEIVPLDGRGIVKVEGFKGALLAQDEKGKQLYIVGGDQSVDISKFGIEQTHELEILGQLRAVLYFTTKDHLRPEDGGTAAYDHKFAKGSMPFVGYDVRNKLLSIQGGGYELPAEGIDG
jgi:hypothetical protein